MKCARCGEEKKTEEMFRNTRRGRPGIASWCKECVKKWAVKQLERTTKAPKGHNDH